MILRKLCFYLFLFISTAVSAQDTTFSREWMAIDSLIKKNDLTRTALQRVESLYQQAKQRNLPDHTIKALLYRSYLEDRITDNNPNHAIATLKNEITNTGNAVTRAVLYSLLAKQYRQYYNNNRWNLYNRKNTAGIIKEDIATWTSDDLTAAITKNYLLSLQDMKLLQQQPALSYRAIIIEGNRNQPITLFDLLAREALDYFKSAETNTTKPVNSYSISDENALGTIETFIQAKFSTRDSSAHPWIALNLFAGLIRFHKNDEDKNLLLRWNLERIEWVYNAALFVNKEKYYRLALDEVIKNYRSTPGSLEAWYLLASLEITKAGLYRPLEDTAGRYSYNKAEEIIRNATGLYGGENPFYARLQNLLKQVNSRELRTQAERVNVPNKPFRVLVGFRNADTVFCRIIRITDDDKLRNNAGNDEFWSTAVSRKTYQSFTQALPLVKDHQLHSVEIKADGLPIGEYALLTSDNKNFNTGDSKMSLQFFYVSNLSYIKNKSDFFILNRDNGKPVPSADITVYKFAYNQQLQKNTLTRATDKITDANGYFRFDEETRVGNYQYDIRKGKDRLFLKQNDMIVYENNEAEYESDEVLEKYDNNNRRIYFFTDRSIYRPGQRVSFKGIGVTKDRKTKLSKLVVSRDSITVYLVDVNQKKIDSGKFQLNSYGSITGSFSLPTSGITGNYSILAKGFNQSSIGFSVEEYKRPSFQVSFEKPKGAYRLNDSVVITGTATAYAGNSIDGAKLAYHVVRNTRYSYPWYYRISPDRMGSREILQGEMVTDAQGRFTIRFKALADDIGREGNPVFDFSVTADITDNNGETRSNTTHVTVGYTSVIVNISVPAVLPVDSLKKIDIITTNLSNEKEPSLVRVKIYSLQMPDHPVRKRYWPRPDQFVMNRKEFSSYFPTDEFEEETNVKSWAVSRLVTEAGIDTKEKEEFSILPRSLAAGYYRIDAETRDKFGNTASASQYIQLFDPVNLPASSFSYQFHYPEKATVQPGETASFISASAAPRLFIIRKTDRARNDAEGYELSERSNKKAETLRYIPRESDRGGVAINEVYVFDNRVYTYTYTVVVPWTNKSLQVKYDSYRDKTEPGNTEHWTVTVQTDSSEKAAAELLTGMYDASLDQFRGNNWPVPSIWLNNPPKTFFNGSVNFIAEMSTENYPPETYLPEMYFRDDRLAMEEYGFVFTNKMLFDRVEERVMTVANGDQNKLSSGILSGKIPASAPVLKIRGKSEDIVAEEETGASSTRSDQPGVVNTRKNFSETAFFFPQLYSDTSGKYRFNFTVPDALTQWKWMSLAHTKDLAFGSQSANIITQKKLMVQGNAPRFMREGDNMEFSAKIVNMEDKEITGQVSFELFDPATNTSVDGWFQNVFPSQYFTVAAGQSFGVRFPVQIPFSYNKPLGWRVIAKSGNMSDGEENTLPVLTNRVLVTESLPLLLQNDTTQRFRFDKLIQTNSETLTHQGLTLEYTTNPAWYAVKALRYLVEYPYECAEQTFNRFYANALAAYIVNKQPVIRKIFEEWKKDSSALLSNLQKNEELKQVLLQETPWIFESETEAAQRKNLAMLFDMARLNTQANTFIEKLLQQQLPNGSFSWFKGGNEDMFITNYILTGIGKLKRLGALTPDLAMRIRTLLGNAITYMDGKIAEDYNYLVKSRADLSKQHIGPYQIDYLYMRSFFGDIAMNSNTAWQYYYNQGKQYWVTQNSYYKAQLGLIAFRNKDEKFATGTVLPSLLENTVLDTKLGMYWKTAYTHWWYQSPVEHQSMMIAFMAEIGKDQHGQLLTKQLNAMRTWLLLNKQTNNWRTTIATADACYVLLLTGTDWLSSGKKVTLQLGSVTIISMDEKQESGTGYFKKRIDGRMVKPAMGEITVTASSTGMASKQNAQPSWGSVYWQYLENADKVTAAGGPLSVTKKLFVEKNTDKGKLLVAIQDGEEVQVGDKIVIRMEIRSDRDMDYLHLKDTRAAGMEPVNVLSGYRWQDRLGYYEATKDASSNFFISHLPKGTYVFEYPVYLSHSGTFSAGIATLQCMYAPEFTSHSEGLKIRVAN